MNGVGQATTEMARRYFDLFVNRLAYTMQSHKPNGNGKHYYYRPKKRSATVAGDRPRAPERSAHDRYLCSEPKDTTLQVGGDRCRL